MPSSPEIVVRSFKQGWSKFERLFGRAPGNTTKDLAALVALAGMTAVLDRRPTVVSKEKRK